VDAAAKRGDAWGRQSAMSSPYATYSANPISSPTTIRRKLPVEPTVPTAPSPVVTASVYAAVPFESPITSPTIAAHRTYRVVNVSKRDFLYLRAGPGSDYPAIARIHPGMGGVTLGSGRRANGSTIWQEISIRGYNGWVNQIYLRPEN